MKKYQLVSLLWLISTVSGQNLVDLRTQTKNVDFSSAASTIPAKSGTVLPAVCNPGEMFFKTNATAGQNLYGCAPANTWTVLSGGSTNGTVSAGTLGQFGFYSVNGSTIVGRTLLPSDIPTLSYQTPLTFTGAGAKTASSTGTVTSNNCAKWDVNGNIVDSGGPCGGSSNIGAGTLGQFAFYSAAGSALTAHTLAPSDIPVLSYQSPLTFTGNGTKTPSSTGTVIGNDCAKWDTNGNIVDSGGPCGGSSNIGAGTPGQFAFYSAAGSALTAHTLAPSDIPVLSYQSPLTFTGNGTKTPSSTGTVIGNDCAKWDANGNIVDSGGPCGGSSNIGAGTPGQFAFYSAAGSALTAHSLAASDIPALSYQTPLTFTGNGTKTPSATGTMTSNDCAKWDANGNIIDSGSPCGNVATGATGQFAFYSANGSALTPHTLVPTDIAGLSYQSPLTFTGSGTKTASSTGTITTNDCAKWDANGNIVDSGAPCGTGSGGSGTIGTGTAGQFAFYSTNGSALTSHTLVASDISGLSYQSPLTFTGNGAKTASSTGTQISNDCAKWDANGNIIDSGSPCGNVATGTAGQFAFYSANGSALTAHSLTSSDIPALNYQSPLTLTGNGTKTASSTGILTSNDCAKWDANGNIIDSGSPCGNVAAGTVGQFAFYSANGSALTAHSLAASDIPALNYQSPLTLTGNGAKTASSTGNLTSNDCAKWDANGNIIDSGSPCGNVAAGTVGQFAFYSANGSALTAHSLAATDIPALNYQSPLTLTGNGAKTASSTGTLTSNDCAKWDANGNIIDSGSPCGNVATGTAGQFAFYSANGSALTAHSLAASDIPALNYQSPLTLTGNGAKTASSTGTLTSNDCAKWDANGNIIDSGSPCGNVATGIAGQFAFYSANGSALTAHSLAATDIPALNYQSPLTLTGNGAKTASSTGTLTSNDCAKWDASGNVIDSGSPCASVATGATGQFAFYSAAGSALTAHSLAVGDIPALNYQAPLTFTGSGAKTASSTGTTTSNDCTKWDASGNVIDSGSPCASVGTGTAGQFAFYSANGSALTSHTLSASDVPVLNYQAPLTFTGNGTKTASSTGTVISSNCAKWDANGNIVDAGTPCGAGSGGISAPSTTTIGNVPQYSTTTGSALSVGLGVTTTIATPGLDTRIPTEKSVRAAITAAVGASGNLPNQTGTAGYLVTDGTTPSWGNIATGGSGALDCATTPGVCDIVTAVVPFKASANTWTGANDFSGASYLRVATGVGIPATGCATTGDVGKVYMRNDTKAVGSSLYLCSQTGNGSFSWELGQGAGGSGMPVYSAAGMVLTTHMVTGRNSFSSSQAALTFTGAAAFSSSTSYACTSNNLSSAAPILVTQTNGTTATFSTTGGATDNFSYICVGN